MKRLKKLMSALLGRTDRHDASAVVLPPRPSRLKKAALVFLAAASAAFFVCDQANSAVPIGDIEITKMGVYYPQRSRTVEEEWHTVYIETNVPYLTVKWYVNGSLKETQTNPFDSTDSYFSYQYPWHGSAAGSDVTIEAVAATLFDEDSDEMSIKVFDDNGFLWRKSIARVESFSHAGGHRYIFTSGHTIDYYNDIKRPGPVFMRRKARWFENGISMGLNWPADKAFTPDTTFWGSVSMTLDTTEPLIKGREYEVEAYTNMTGEEQSTVRSASARYNPLAGDPLPIPTGVEGVNENEGLPDALK